MVVYDDYGVPVGAYSEPETLTHQAYRVARAFILYRVRPVAQRGFLEIRSRRWTWKSLLTLVKVLIVVWFVALYWGERMVFKDSIDACRWENWENWASDANPHRVLFVADPQLVDPHTYPGRPWPLNTLTVKFTDQYIRRTYSRMQKVLYPDTTAFLGDLFDGGREWSTRTTKSPETRYQKYGNSFWLKEYDRFGRIFFDHWGDGGMAPRPGQPGRKIISSLPGNHDLGFAKGIQTGVRNRFNAYFGDGNRMDIIGNHTFVSLDSVSLSAFGEPDSQSLEELWKPAINFLKDAKTQKTRLVQRELRAQQGLRPYPQFSHDIINEQELVQAVLPHSDDSVTEFPTILLTHVPLYRAPGTPCGPFRERWPPTPPPKGQTEPLENDERNAIRVAGGYQYQNVLRREITVDIAEKVGDIQYAFSGDDHDYCEVVHKDYDSSGSGIREITVKSISWAMGVRKPGVLLVSLWNPVDERGNSLLVDSSGPTIQTQLCLLPDQLEVFIRYGALFGITLVTLAIRAALIAAGISASSSTANSDSLLPTVEHTSSAENEKADPSSHRQPDSCDTSSNSSTSSERGKLQVRSSNARTRSGSPNTGYGLPATQGNYSYPLVQHAGYFGPAEDEEERKGMKVWGTVTTKKTKPKKKGLALIWHEFVYSLLRVGVVVFGWYFWLIRHW
ncbi:hypothetical protein K505DRAFT_378146 [Melanomma pulvis-pyrius CBS 109.77]|uniref:Uncharacterized protein n=1 Tax=Melanomma pulvis-pyrius CBS 109.77 TaxID=1314802 RepID=A0A6A6WZM3_9PLEO|nr:hypothetical protein K505DRAFT_378146 [Melanomma pulvis-pyrius CBS 109.77]